MAASSVPRLKDGQKCSVLFVCLGNICRSPMAEAVFKHTIVERGVDHHFETVDSCGTSNFHIGETPDRRSHKCCTDNGVKVDHRARQLSPEDFQDFDVILGMDDSNVEDIKEELRASGSRSGQKRVFIGLLGQFDPDGERIIKDPYYGGTHGFQHNFKQCQRSCNALIDVILPE